MSVFPKRIFSSLRYVTERSLILIGAKQDRSRHHLYTKGQAPLSLEKQARLDKLCEQLLKKQELITSGKLQFIGLAKIKRRLGKRWKGLSKIVYETVEEVINGYLSEKTDFFVRYKDEVYFLLFLQSTTEEGQEKASAIAEEIRRRLFELDEKELRNLEIRESIGVLTKDSLKDCDLYEFLDAFAEDDNFLSSAPDVGESEARASEISCIEVDAKDCRPVSGIADMRHIVPDAMYYGYLPLWDVKRGALTTYLCLARNRKQYDNIFDAHKELYLSASPEERLVLDIEVLKSVARELKTIERDNKKFLIACPVQYETLHHFESYEIYKKILKDIPEGQRVYLILYVMDIDQKLPVEDAYWFIKPVKEYCRHVFAELPLGQDINFNYMRNLGVDAVGFRIGDADISRPEVLQMINRFSFRAKGLRIPMTFIFELSSISIATSSFFTEYDYVGGEAIHHEVARPDRMLRFSSENLLMRLIKQRDA